MWSVVARAIDTIARIFVGKKAQPFTGPIQDLQVDLTERFGGDQRLEPEDWIETMAINRNDPDPESAGLPSLAG